MTAAHFALKSSVPGFLRSAARVLMSWPPLSPARKYVARAYERLSGTCPAVRLGIQIQKQDSGCQYADLRLQWCPRSQYHTSSRRAARMPARRTSALATTEASSSEPGRHFEEIQGRMT